MVKNNTEGIVIPQDQGRGDVPLVLLLFTCLICTGATVNVTVVIPTATLYSTSLLHSAFIISTYSVGAMIGLVLFRNVPTSVRQAFLLHCLGMTVGNLGYYVFSSSHVDSYTYTGVIVSRIIVGLAGGVMYNANVALIEFSSPEKKVRYLSIYQFFLGFGLLLGPALSSTTTLIGQALGVEEDRYALANLVMTVWGVALGIMVFWKMPDNKILRELAGMSSSLDEHNNGESHYEELQDDSDDDVTHQIETPDKSDDDCGSSNTFSPIWKIALGNFLRITERIMWETGSVVVMSTQFGWSLVTAGYVVGSLGGAQTVAQLLYAYLNPQNNPKSVTILEILELAGIILLFGAGHETGAITFKGATRFLLGSTVAYCANCLMSAPYNAILLEQATEGGATAKLDQSTLLLSSQYGIFLGFLVGPLLVRSIMEATAENQNILAAVLLLGWVAQTLLNVLVSKRPMAKLGTIVGFAAVAFLTWAVFDKRVGGTGIDNVFSWHPILMAMAFMGFMNAGQFAYTKGPPSDGLLATTQHGPKKQVQRRLHSSLMALSAICAIGGYTTVFYAHAQIGESQIGFNATIGRAIHVWLGYIALLWMLVQMLSGPFKAWHLEMKNERIFPWHGRLGRYHILFSFAVATLGFWVHMNFTGDGGWGASLKLVLTSFSALLFGLVCLNFHESFPVDVAQGSCTKGMQMKEYSFNRDDSQPQAYSNPLV